MDNKEDLEQTVRDPGEIAGVTFDLLKEYLEDLELISGEINCSECGKTSWNIFRSPLDKEKPNVVTFPMPFTPGYGIWSFPVACDSCGSMRFFEASTVLDELRKSGKL